MTVSELKSIEISDMKNIALGGSFLGTGGGGDPYIGRLMACLLYTSPSPRD